MIVYMLSYIHICFFFVLKFFHYYKINNFYKIDFIKILKKNIKMLKNNINDFLFKNEK